MSVIVANAFLMDFCFAAGVDYSLQDLTPESGCAAPSTMLWMLSCIWPAVLIQT